MADWFVRDAGDDDERAVAAFMTRLASIRPAGDQSFTDPSVLWWKAQLLRRWEAERRAQTPLDVMEPVQIIAGLIAAGLLLAWAFPSLLRVFSLIGV
jgi:hypothetical protein